MTDTPPLAYCAGCGKPHGLAVTFADDPSQCDKGQRFDA